MPCIPLTCIPRHMYPQVLSSDSYSRFLHFKAWQRLERADNLHVTYNNALPQSLRPMGKNGIGQSA